MQASNVCMASGLHPGTHAYQRCYAANYTNLRANSQQAENAAVAGAALGVAGGALAGAAIANSNGYYYGGYGPGWGYCCAALKLKKTAAVSGRAVTPEARSIT